MSLIFFVFLAIGLGIIAIYPLLLFMVSRGKKGAEIARSRADEIRKLGNATATEINVVIDQLQHIKDRRVVPFLEEDQVRIDALRKLRG